MAREIDTIAVGHDPSQFSLDGLLINGLEVRVHAVPGRLVIHRREFEREHIVGRSPGKFRIF